MVFAQKELFAELTKSLSQLFYVNAKTLHVDITDTHHVAYINGGSANTFM